MIEERSSWKDVLKETDNYKFYEYLKKSYANNYNQHSVGHIFGEILFDKEGFVGVVVCDDAFFWGCHHGFVSRALVDGGEENIHKLFEGCKKMNENEYQQCIHGIGHGLIGLFGSNGLTKSLNICDSLDGNESCYTGVFMEYNFPTVSKKGIFVQEVRTLGNNIYYPCQRFIGGHAKSCYYELPRLWERVFKSDFQKIGNACENINSAEYKRDCYRGVGEVTSLTTDHDLDKTIDLCSKMPSEMGKNICLISSALGFANTPNKKDQVDDICKLVDNSYKTECPKN